jgi:flagellar basal-body rod protein FlgB
MALIDTTQIALSRAITGATVRQSTLATNLANANTPGYLPQDVDFHSTLRSAMNTGTERALESTEFLPTSRGSGPLRADGNGVDPDAEAAKLAQAGLELNALTRIAGARIDILRSAMGVR